MEKYQCPVCGYPDLKDPPYDPITNASSFDICPCCGCEYGYNDATPWAKRNHLLKWLKRGAPWFMPELRPANWDVKTKLRRAGIDFEDKDRESI